MRWVSYALIAVLLMLQYRLWFGSGSLPESWRLKREISEQTISNERFAAINAELRREVEALKSEPELIEEYAREELGFIRRGETFFMVIE